MADTTGERRGFLAGTDTVEGRAVPRDDDRAEASGRRSAVPGRPLVPVTPTRVVARKSISD